MSKSVHLPSGCVALAAFLYGGTSLAANVTIDFTTNVTTVVGDPNIIDRIPPATFSHYLQTHPDGFTQYTGGSYNYYGENDELITFDSPVKLVSVDLQMPFLTLPQPTHLHLQMLDSNDVLLAEVVEDPAGAVVTVPFNVGKVKKLVFHFEGGDPTFYSDGRSHAWYYIDNLVYDPAGCVLDTDCSPPNSACEPNGSCGQCSSTVMCVAPDACHAGSCDLVTGLCSSPALTDGTPCNDGNGCTQADACETGVCTGTNPVTCAAPDECHDAGTCQPASGTCTFPNKVDGTACTGGTCQGGVCQLAASSASSTSATTSSSASNGTSASSGTSASNGTSASSATAATGAATTGAGNGGASAGGSGGGGSGSDSGGGCGCIVASDDDGLLNGALWALSAVALFSARRERRRR